MTIGSTGRAVKLDPGVAAALRGHEQTLRQRGPAPPPPDVRDLKWSELSPPGYKPGEILQRLGVSALEDGDPRVPAMLAQVQTEWQRAPAVQVVPAGAVRLVGFGVMLDEGAHPVKRVLLVPYYGACIHSPPPPANQVVLLSLERELPRNMDQFPIWITGRIEHKPATTKHGRALYQMTNAKWEAYPWPKHPLPGYRLPQ